MAGSLKAFVVAARASFPSLHSRSCFFSTFFFLAFHPPASLSWPLVADLVVLSCVSFFFSFTCCVFVFTCIKIYRRDTKHLRFKTLLYNLCVYTGCHICVRSSSSTIPYVSETSSRRMLFFFCTWFWRVAGTGKERCERLLV